MEGFTNHSKSVVESNLTLCGLYKNVKVIIFNSVVNTMNTGVLNVVESFDQFVVCVPADLGDVSNWDCMVRHVILT